MLSYTSAQEKCDSQLKYDETHVKRILFLYRSLI